MFRLIFPQILTNAFGSFAAVSGYILPPDFTNDPTDPSTLLLFADGTNSSPTTKKNLVRNYELSVPCANVSLSDTISVPGLPEDANIMFSGTGIVIVDGANERLTVTQVGTIYDVKIFRPTWFVTATGTAGNGSGTEADPWQKTNSIDWAVIKPGHKLVMDGEFLSQYFSLGASGTPTNKIHLGFTEGTRLDYESTSGKVIRLGSQSNWVISGNKEENGLKGTELAGGTEACIAQSGVSNGIELYNLWLHGSKNGATLLGENNRVVSCTVEDMSGSGIISFRNVSGYIAKNKIRRCGTAGTNSDGIYLGNGSIDAVAEYNYVDGIIGTAGSSGIDSSSVSGEAPQNVTIRYNEIHNSGYYGIGMGDELPEFAGEIHNCHHNIIINTKYGLGARSKGTYNYYNNLIKTTSDAGIIVVGDDPSTVINFKNNIIVDASGYTVHYELMTSGTINFGRNCYDVGSVFRWTDATSKNLTEWRTLTSQDVDTIEADPLLNFENRLTNSSPCLETGAEVGFTQGVDPESSWPDNVVIEDYVPNGSFHIGPWSKGVA